MCRAIDETEIESYRRGPAISVLQRRRQRIEQAREDERQRFEGVNRPFQRHRLEESRHARVGHEWRAIDPASELLKREAVLPQSLGQFHRRQRCDFTERREAPSPERVQPIDRCLQARPFAVNVVVLDEHAQRIEWQQRDRRGAIAVGDRRAWMGNRQQTRCRLRTRDGNANVRRICVRRARQLHADRLRRAEQTSKPADVQHHARIAMTFDARRKIPRDQEMWCHRARRFRDPGSGIREPGRGDPRIANTCI
jgi:hypothetical protein